MTTLEIASTTRQAARCFTSNSDGSVTIEYVLAGAPIGAGVLVGVTMLSGAVTDIFGCVIAAFNS
jgi:Flp pilus assembly pilin Flp